MKKENCLGDQELQLRKEQTRTFNMLMKNRKLGKDTELALALLIQIGQF